VVINLSKGITDPGPLRLLKQKEQHMMGTADYGHFQNGECTHPQSPSKLTSGCRCMAMLAQTVIFWENLKEPAETAFSQFSDVSAKPRNFWLGDHL
jgi:hypothetical protein